MGESLMKFPNGSMVEAMVDARLHTLKIPSYRKALVQEPDDHEQSRFTFIVEVSDKQYSMKIKQRELEDSTALTLLSLNLEDLVFRIKRDVKP